MFLSALTTNLNWESLTKNLVTFNFNIMEFHWKIRFFQEGGGTRTKKGQSLDSLQRGKRPSKKQEDGVFAREFFHNFGRQGASHDITKSVDSQTNTNFSGNDCMTAEFYKNVYQRNDFRLRTLGNKRVLEKDSNWVETNARYCLILLDFFIQFQIFCPGLQMFIILGNKL